MKTEKFNYHLPEHLIAKYPSDRRSDSKLLVAIESLQHDIFKNIGSYFTSGDLLVLNQTSVIPARLFGEKSTGGKIEILLERFLSDSQTLAQVKSARTPMEGSELVFLFGKEKFTAKVIGRKENFFILEWSIDPQTLFINHGQIPLPPYMKRDPEPIDNERYETIYANPEKQASVAAPTAGMHFDDALLKELISLGVEIGHVNLNVGAGTFQPVKSDNIEDHIIHKEVVEVDSDLIKKLAHTKASNGKIIAVGTTSVRALETACQNGFQPFRGETDLFIYPGYKFKVVDHMITNFHLPKSSLLMLVAAFVGYERMMEIYSTAIKNEYRFLSYGDAMLLRNHEI